MTEKEILDTIDTEEGKQWYLKTWEAIVKGKVKPETVVAELTALKFEGYVVCSRCKQVVDPKGVHQCEDKSNYTTNRGYSSKEIQDVNK